MRAMEDWLAWPRIDGTDRALEMFLIFAFPPEFPAHWVVRRQFVLETGDVRPDVVPRLAHDLEGARDLVPAGLFRQSRDPGDEPHIIEVWF